MSDETFGLLTIKKTELLKKIKRGGSVSEI